MLSLLPMKTHIRFSLLYISYFQSVLGNSAISSNPVPATTTTYNPRQENCYSTPAAASLPHFPAPSTHDPNPGHQTRARVLDLRSSDFTTRDDAQLVERSDTVSTAITITTTTGFILTPDLTAVSPGEAQKWHLTTYWSCVTYYDVTTTTHCGWHEPVLPGGDEISGAPGKGFEDGGRVVGVAVAAAAGVSLLEMVLF
jgi:hypothetical protein